MNGHVRCKTVMEQPSKSYKQALSPPTFLEYQHCNPGAYHRTAHLWPTSTMCLKKEKKKKNLRRGIQKPRELGMAMVPSEPKARDSCHGRGIDCWELSSTIKG